LRKKATGGNAAAFIEKTGNLIKQPDGLPNITGAISVATGNAGGGIATGAFYAGGEEGDAAWSGVKGRSVRRFDASRSSPIYGSSEHVTPENYTAKLWLRVA